MKKAEELIGTKVIYKDYLGFERSGTIGFFEDYLGGEPDDSGSKTVWLYIADDDQDYNNKEFIYNAGTIDKPDIKHLMYADLRLSTEVVIDE